MHSGYRPGLEVLHIVHGTGIRVFEFVNDLAGFNVAVKRHFTACHGERTVAVVGMFDNERAARGMQGSHVLADDAVAINFVPGHDHFVTGAAGDADESVK